MDKASGSESPSQDSSARAPEQLHFTGSGAEYFGIWIVNLLLTILTLGIYSAWAKVRRYGALILMGVSIGPAFHALITNLIWNNTRLGGGHRRAFPGQHHCPDVRRILAGANGARRAHFLDRWFASRPTEKAAAVRFRRRNSQTQGTHRGGVTLHDRLVGFTDSRGS
jgi:hypothetical protein